MAKAWLIEYRRLDAKPQRGVIVFGAGLDRAAWLDLASSEGYYVQDCGSFAVLR